MTFRAKIANLQGAAASQIRELKFQIARLGKGAITGISLLLLAALGLSLILIAQNDLAELQQQITALNRQLATGDRPGTTITNMARTPIFPGPEAREKMLVRIQQLAVEAGLNAESGAYHEVRSNISLKAGGSPLIKYQVSMPLHGSYPALRNWLSAVMNEMPSMALEELNIRRDNVLNPEVEAQLRFAFYFEER